MRASAEWLATHERRRLAGRSERHQHLPVQRAAPHAMGAVVGEPDCIIGSHMHAMRAWKHAFAPGSQEIALAIEDDHRVFAAIENVDIVVAVDPDRADFMKTPAAW